jgi:hypothetical protein
MLAATSKSSGSTGKLTPIVEAPYSPQQVQQESSSEASAGTGYVATDYSGLSNAELNAKVDEASRAISNPMSIFGVDVTRTGVGFGASVLAGLTGAPGLVSMAASFAAKQAVDASRRNTLHELTMEQAKREAAAELENIRAIEEAKTPVVKDPIGDLIASLEAKEQAKATDDPLGTWLAANLANDIPTPTEPTEPADDPTNYDEAGLQSVVEAAMQSEGNNLSGYGNDGGYNGSDYSDFSGEGNW